MLWDICKEDFGKDGFLILLTNAKDWKLNGGNCSLTLACVGDRFTVNITTCPEPDSNGDLCERSDLRRFTNRKAAERFFLQSMKDFPSIREQVKQIESLISE